MGHRHAGGGQRGPDRHRPLRTTLNVGDLEARLELSEMAVNLGEIVVTDTVAGAEKRTLGNSVSTVRAAEVQELAPAPDMSSLINSRAPGVVVIPGTGQVGSAPRIRLRGANSFSLSDQPLIYIDGVRVANDVSTGIQVQAFGSGIAGRLNDIDPDNIESIEILKGPAGSTLYGTEAANGVIQIITKRGRIGDRPLLTRYFSTHRKRSSHAFYSQQSDPIYDNRIVSDNRAY